MLPTVGFSPATTVGFIAAANRATCQAVRCPIVAPTEVDSGRFQGKAEDSRPARIFNVKAGSRQKSLAIC